MEAYNETDAISKSGLDKIDSSPLDYWWHFLRPQREPYTPDKSTLFDNALRMAVFNPSAFAATYIRMPQINRSTNVGKAEYASLLADAESKNLQLMTPTDFDTIRGMQQAVFNHPIAKILCGAGQIGMPLRFTEENTGAQVKFKPHWVHAGGIIVHLMSTENAGQKNFQKEAANFRHDKRAALQMDGLQMDGMAFLMVENKEPYKIGIWHLDDRSIVFGRETYVRNCETYVQCLESGKWPGLPEIISPVGLPEWIFKT